MDVNSMSQYAVELEILNIQGYRAPSNRFDHYEPGVAYMRDGQWYRTRKDILGKNIHEKFDPFLNMEQAMQFLRHIETYVIQVSKEKEFVTVYRVTSTNEVVTEGEGCRLQEAVCRCYLAWRTEMRRLGRDTTYIGDTETTHDENMYSHEIKNTRKMTDKELYAKDVKTGNTVLFFIVFLLAIMAIAPIILQLKSR